MPIRKRFFTNILDERIAYRLVLSFALMSIIPTLLTTYLIATIWLPSWNLWGQVGLFLMLGLSVSILGFFLSRTVVYTILKTSERAKEIADGDLSKRLEVENERSEIALLARAFNQITAQLQQKIKDLEISEEKFRKLVDNVPDLLYYLDLEGNITSVNEEVLQLLGYTKEELLGKPFSAIVREEDYEKYEHVLRERRAQESRLVKGLRVRLKTADGAFRTFEINSRGIYDPDDNYVGTEGLARDITVQLALESEREEFLYMLTHDIKNPVSAIMFIIYMMRDGTIPSNKYPEYYDKIERACNNVTRLVEDFLECKKFERGAIDLDRRKVDLHKMLSTIAHTYRSEAEAKGKSLKENIERNGGGKASVVEVDERYFPRVVENLVTNAIKFAHSQVDIGMKEDGENVTIFVRDDGPGVSEKEKKDLFKLFHSSSGTRMSKGIGVGLASAHKIVLAHGGRVWVESDPRGGCAFFVSIPRNPAAVESKAPQKISV
jgi:two-component system sensor histidine kinase VicK